MKFWRLIPILLLFFSLSAEGEDAGFAGLEISYGYNRRLIAQRPVPKGDFKKLVIPVKRVGNLIIVEATVDGIRGNFIFDTGAPYLVLNATYFRDYEEDNQHMATDVNGNVVPQKITKVERLKVLGMHYENLEADVSDLSAIENRRGIQILGLLGVNLFMRMEIELDMRNEQLIVYRVDREGRRLEAPYLATENEFRKSFSLENNAIIAQGSIDSLELDLCFDTGAEALLLDNDLPAKAYEQMRITRTIELNGAGGSSAEVLVGAIRKLEFGPDLENCQIMIADLEEIGRAYGHPVDGFVGYDLLRKGSVCINFKTQELIINVYP